MNAHISSIVLGVRDMARAKKFYSEGLGWKVTQEFGPEWVAFALGDGRQSLGLHPWDKLAAEAGVAPEGTGFRGATYHYVVRTPERVDELLAAAARAGATIVKPAVKAPWGAYGYFADPDGYLWKVASGNESPFAAE